MANEEKIRILDEQPAENAGSLLYIRTLAGSSDASKPTSQLANGSIFIETDTGKVFIFDEENGWTEMQAGGSSGGGEKFIVTLTPTAQDFSGTMDKTVEQINAAYEAGQEIVFRVIMSATAYMDVDCTGMYKSGDYTYPAFNAYIVDDIHDVFIFASTIATDDGTIQIYSTTIYSLTPAS